MNIMAYRANGSTASIERVFLYKDSGATAGTEGDPITGLTSASSGLIISTIANNEATATTYTAAGSTTETITTLGTYAAPTATKCRFKEVDATNHPGLYEVQFADARYAVASAEYLDISITGVADLATMQGRIYLDVMDEAGIRSALGLAAANLDTQLSTIDTVVDGIAVDYATSDDITGVETTLSEAINGTTPFQVDILSISGDTVAADNAESFFDGTGYSGTNNVIPSVTLVDTCTTNTDMRGTDSAATAANLATVDTVVDAIKVKTDSLTFTVANKVDANTKSINDVIVTGTGVSTNLWRA